MKRLPLIAGFVLFIALCVSAAYWAMQLFKPAARPVAAPPPSKTEARPEAAAGLFGGRASGTAVATNYALRGVVLSGTPGESVAILAAEGKPPQAIRVDTEIEPGVKVTEVHRGYVMLTEGGVSKRVELPESAPSSGAEGIAMPRTPIPVPAQPQPAQAASPLGSGQNPQGMNGQAGAAQPPQVVTRPQPGSQSPAVPPANVQAQPGGNNQLRPGTTSVFDPNSNPNLAPQQPGAGTAPVAEQPPPPSPESAAPADSETVERSPMPGGGHPGLIER